MPEQRVQPARRPTPASLTREERRSLTHGNFRISPQEFIAYQRVLNTLNRAAVPCVVSGLYAMHAYTGVYRKTKDLDLLFDPEVVLDAARVLRDAGFRVHLAQAHWLAKAEWDGRCIDLIFGMGNGLALVDGAWYRHSRPTIFADVQVRVAPPEELLWHRLYVSERHRHDMADVLHLILCQGDIMDWKRLLGRLTRDYRLLQAHVHLYDFAYPGYRSRIPDSVRDWLADRFAHDGNAEDQEVCNGTLISRFSFNIDVREWGLHDPRAATIEATERLPIIDRIRRSSVWHD